MGAMLQIDPNSTEWAAVKGWAADKLATAIADLKSPVLTQDRTQYVRGQIAALEELLALPETAKTAPEQIVQPGY